MHLGRDALPEIPAEAWLYKNNINCAAKPWKLKILENITRPHFNCGDICGASARETGVNPCNPIEAISPAAVTLGTARDIYLTLAN